MQARSKASSLRVSGERGGEMGKYEKVKAQNKSTAGRQEKIRGHRVKTKEKGNSNVKTTYNRLCIEGHQLTSTIHCLIIPKWHTKNKPKSTAIKSYRKRTVFFFPPAGFMYKARQSHMQSENLQILQDKRHPLSDRKYQSA